MARRDFRQPGPADGVVRRPGEESEWLDRPDAALDRPAPGAIVEGVRAGREGGLAYPVLTHLRLPLPQRWHGPQDEGPEAAVDDRLSLRRFAGIPLAGGVPDHGSVQRFREELAERGPAGRSSADVDRRLDAGGLIPRRGTLVDAAILEAAARPATRARPRAAARGRAGRGRTAGAASAARPTSRSARAAGSCARRP